MVDPRTSALHRWLRTHHGVITRRRLQELGFSRSAVRWQVESGRLLPMWDGVYVDPSHERGRAQVMTGICQLYPAAAVGFTTAGREWGLRGMVDERVHILVPHATTPHVSGLPELVIHRCRRIDPVDVAGTRLDGIRLTSPPRTLFDSAAILDTDTVASAVEQALADQRCTIGTLMSTLARLRHPRRPGAQRFEEVLHSRSTLRGAARSHLELVVRKAIAAVGLPEPEINMWMRLVDGSRIQIDLAWPEHLVGVEVDHPFWHDREAEAARDKHRDLKLATMGWQCVRLSERAIEQGLAEAVADIGAVLVRRGWSPTAA